MSITEQAGEHASKREDLHLCICAAPDRATDQWYWPDGELVVAELTAQMSMDTIPVFAKTKLAVAALRLFGLVRDNTPRCT